jgi:hypothetical protein
MNTGKHTSPDHRAQYNAVRAHFVSHGTSLRAWCDEQLANGDRGIHRQNVSEAFLGPDHVRRRSWACKLRARLLEVAEVDDEQRAS